MLAKERLHGAARPVVHGGGQHLHRDGVDAQKVADEHHSLDPLRPRAESRQRADVVRDGDEGGAGEVLRPRVPPSLPAVHLAEAAGHEVTVESEAPGWMDGENGRKTVVLYVQ